MRLTPAQERALLFLPADGSWTTKPLGRMAPAAASLALYHKDLVDYEFGDFGRWRLTARGVKAALERARNPEGT